LSLYTSTKVISFPLDTDLKTVQLFDQVPVR
jgi:hypothetical protein